MAADCNQRRRHLLGAGIGLIAGALNFVRPAWADAAVPASGNATRRALCSGRVRQTAAGLRYELTSLEIAADRSLREVSNIDLTSRAHGIIATRRLGEAIVCARRPGAWLLRADLLSGKVLARYENENQRWFQGHVCLSADGTTLFAGEVDEDDHASIGVFDARTLQRHDSIPSGGVEPHELLLADKQTLLIAHGGRHDTLRSDEALDAQARCDSTLTWLDLSSGKMVAQHRPADVRISLRHLAAVDAENWAVAAQSGADTPLAMVALANRSTGLSWLEAEPQAAANYVASITADSQRIAAAAPHTGRVLCWDARGRRARDFHCVRATGAVSDGAVIWVSGERGVIAPFSRLTADRSESQIERGPMRWDNHLTLIALPEETVARS